MNEDMDGKQFVYGGKRYEVPAKYAGIRFDDKEFRRAIATIIDGEYPLVTISGAGGCGKSVIYRIINDRFPGRCLCAASTGVAAFNIAQNGVECTTIHSALKIVPPKEWYDWTSLLHDTVDILKSYDYLLIDEVSMVNCNLMDYILAHVNEANAQRNDGGSIKVVLFGDVLQLAPVSPLTGRKRKGDLFEDALRGMWRERYGEAEIGYWFFSPILKSMKRVTIELKTVYRQDDSSFRALLDTIRFGRQEDLPGVLDRLSTRVVPLEEHEKAFSRKGRPMLHLSGRNRDVALINAKSVEKLMKKGDEHHSYSALVGHAGDDDAYARFTKDTKKLFEKFFPTLSEYQTLYIGQQVMCLTNDRDGRFQNGTLGKVVSFSHETQEDLPEELKGMKLPPRPVVEPYDGRARFTVPYARFEHMAAQVDEKTRKVSFSSVLSVIALACRSAYAVTFHKAQGLTLDAVYIDTRHGKDGKGGSYIPDSGLYLGLSRSRTLEGVGLSERVTADQISVNRWAMMFFSEDRDGIVPLDGSAARTETGRRTGIHNVQKAENGNHSALSEDEDKALIQKLRANKALMKLFSPGPREAHCRDREKAV